MIAGTHVLAKGTEKQPEDLFLIRGAGGEEGAVGGPVDRE